MTELPTERTRAALDRNAENRSREAWSAHRYDITGAGYAEFPKSARFDLAFLDQPFVNYGLVLDSDELRRVLNVADTANPAMPTVTAWVTEYDQNERGFYVGAWCAVNVTWPGEPPDPEEGFTFQVDFTWRGIGIKDVDPEVRA